MAVPKYQALFNPVLDAMRRLGGSASIAELDDEVIESLGLTDDDVIQPHDQRQTELQYRLAWARTYLKAYGLLDNTARGVWILSAKGKEAGAVDPQAVTRFVQNAGRERRSKQPAEQSSAEDAEIRVAEAVLEQTWREQLLATLLNLPPDAFERLCQRLLRESGFVQVRVTGRAGDGGIDGVGIVRIGGLLGFPVLFQCKRYRGSVGASAIRDFRGAMVGRANRGLVITTGTFSRDARSEATRDGAPPIDLVDGEELMDKLKELRLGVGLRTIEEVFVRTDWFTQI